MSKITKSNTKEEILEALDKALEEQNVLHTEVTTLNGKIEGLEILVQEEDVKKKGLITELANQSVDIDLAKQQTEQLDDLVLQLGEANAKLDSAEKEREVVQNELFTTQKKVEMLTEELDSFKNRALPPKAKKTKRGFFKFMWKKAAVVAVVAVIIVAYNFYNLSGIESPMNIATYDNGIIAMSHDPNMLTLTATDGGDLGISGVDVSIAKWAKKAGFSGILYGQVLKNDLDIIVLAGNDKFDYTTVDINKLADKFRELGCYSILALVDNPSNLNLPAPFRVTSKGALEFYEGRRKLAGFIPVMWGKDQRVFYIASDNVKGFISSGGIFMDDGNTSTAVAFDNAELEN